jgi:hypothetical protein
MTKTNPSKKAGLGRALAAVAFSPGGDGGKETSDICLRTMGDDLPPSQGAVKYPKLARLLAFVALLVFGAVTLAWWGFLAWLIWHVI